MNTQQSSKKRARKPAAPAQQPIRNDEERTAYLTGRILRGLDGERFKAFVDLITDLGAGRVDVREVLDNCEIIARVIEGRRSEQPPDEITSQEARTLAQRIIEGTDWGTRRRTPGSSSCCSSYAP